MWESLHETELHQLVQLRKTVANSSRPVHLPSAFLVPRTIPPPTCAGAPSEDEIQASKRSSWKGSELCGSGNCTTGLSSRAL